MEPSELVPLFKWLVVMYDFMLGKINRKINWIGFFRKLIWVVRWLRRHFSMQGMLVRSLVRKLRPHMPPGPKKTKNIKQKQYCNEFNKYFKKKKKKKTYMIYNSGQNWSKHKKWDINAEQNHQVCYTFTINMGFPCGSAGKESACSVGDLGLIPGLGRSPGEGKGYPLQYSGLENSMDYTVHGV